MAAFVALSLLSNGFRTSTAIEAERSEGKIDSTLGGKKVFQSSNVVATKTLESVVEDEAATGCVRINPTCEVFAGSKGAFLNGTDSAATLPPLEMADSKSLSEVPGDRMQRVEVLSSSREMVMDNERIDAPDGLERLAEAFKES